MTTNLLYAQQRCGTDELNAQRTAKMSVQQKKQVEADEIGYQDYVQNPISRAGGAANVRVIPVVVHLIQMTPAEEISDARVQSQIDVLNEDFQKLNADTALIPLEFQGVAANCQIRFCLASIDPNGCPTNGINRVVAPALAIHGMDDEAALKGFVQWPPQQYLNMWVPVNLKDNLLGYATFPTWLSGSPQNDGVVVNGKNFGRGFGTPFSSYNLGRTATHEVGHWLGLFHTFQGGCSGNSAATCASQGDRVCDTPPTNNSNYGCPGQMNSCTETPTDFNDQTMNYMDYVDDACMYLYTQGQSDRITYFLDNNRAQIWSPSNLTATGCDGTTSPGCVPIVDFQANKRIVCIGDSIEFTELTGGSANTWNWSFQAGSPANSNLPCPKVAWSTVGSYQIELIASNSIGADTAIKLAYIEVVDPAQQTLIDESFEQIGTTFPLGWYATDEFAASGFWKSAPNSGSDGQKAIRLDNFSNSVAGSKQFLYSIPYQFSSVNAGWMYFDRAYKRRDAFTVDSLQIFASTDCGNNWQMIWAKAGNALRTVGGYASSAEYQPSANDWVTDSVDLSNFVGSNSIRFLFKGIGGASQSIYLDYLRFNLITNVNDANVSELKLEIRNNPFTDIPKITVLNGSGKRISSKVFDAQGKLIFELPAHAIQRNHDELKMEAMQWESLREGIYFLVLSDGSHQISTKLLKLRAK